MSTGGDKPITFRVPAPAREGVYIMMTPLTILAKDQVQYLREKGIRATVVHSGMSQRETTTVLGDCIFGGVELLYISPEHIGSELFLMKLRRVNVSFITIDEARCVSQ